MANSYNKIILVGRIGRDAELRATPKGTQVAETSVAVDDLAKKKPEGGYETEWYRIKVWGRQAETLAPMLLKGNLVLVEGRLSIRMFESSRDKQMRYSAEVSTDRVVLLGSPGGQRSAAARDVQPVDELDQTSSDINADDIPF
jgi:single-strand DNA-binding protein